MKKALVLFSLCLTCLLLVACGKANTTQNEKLSSKPKIEGFHYYGAIPERTKKIASLSSTYTGYLLKLGYKPVAVTPYDAKNPVLKDKVSQAKVLSSEDQEALVNLKPDLIVIDSSDKNVDKLAKIAPTIAIDYGKQDYLNILTSFGKVFDQEKQAKDWIKNWNEKTAKVGKELKAKLGENATFTVIGLYEKDIDLFGNNWGRGGEVIYQALGFKAPQKVVDDVFKAGYLEVSQEVLPKYIGDYAIVAAEDEKTGASLYESDVWRSIPAVQQGHILKVNANAFYFNDPLSLEYELKTIENGLKAME